MRPVESVSSACHHVTVLTPDHDRLVRFLVDVFNLRVKAALQLPHDDIAGLYGWARRSGTVRSTLLGRGHAGLIEIVDLPEMSSPAKEFTGQPRPGPFQLCLNVTDVQSVLSDAESAGADASVGPLELSISGATILVGTVVVAGVRFHLTQMDTIDGE